MEKWYDNGYPSMKVPPKRKGNAVDPQLMARVERPSMKVPPKRKGNCAEENAGWRFEYPSMKVPPKRKGNLAVAALPLGITDSLNESPSEKEGK